MIPVWLHITSLATLGLGLICAAIIALDEHRHPQRMWIMNAVWPLTALFGTLPWLWGYFRYGRLNSKTCGKERQRTGETSHPKKPFAAAVAEASSHCGSGCTLGDICAEWLAFAVPVVATWFGWHALFSEKIFAVWILDYIFAFGFGIVFQYFTIVPMKKLGFAKGVWAALKADTLSLTAWQLGMYGFMAVAYFGIFRSWLGVELRVDTAEFWFVMQIAMMFGFMTSYPVNWWLLKTGLKERM
jgi:hypothetical protein